MCVSQTACSVTEEMCATHPDWAGVGWVLNWLPSFFDQLKRTWRVLLVVIVMTHISWPLPSLSRKAAETHFHCSFCRHCKISNLVSLYGRLHGRKKNILLCWYDVETRFFSHSVSTVQLDDVLTEVAPESTISLFFPRLWKRLSK